MFIAKDGTTISQSGPLISCSDGTSYNLYGSMLSGPGGVVDTNVSNISEVIGIVLWAALAAEEGSNSMGTKSNSSRKSEAASNMATLPTICNFCLCRAYMNRSNRFVLRA